MAAIDDLRTDMEKQISELKEEVSRLSKSLSERASEALADADEVYEDLKDRAGGAARQVRRQARAVSEAAWENPGTAATVVSSAGLIGFVAGLLVSGLLTSTPERSGWRW